VDCVTCRAAMKPARDCDRGCLAGAKVERYIYLGLSEVGVHHADHSGMAELMDQMSFTFALSV
jgi:hypothetical protein